MPPRSRSKAKQQDDGLVDVTLAHHLPQDNRFTPDGAPARPGDELRVRPDVAAHLRAAGYATPAEDADDDGPAVDGPVE